MPFAYFVRLTRRQQAIYLKSDAIAMMTLPQPEALRPLVATLSQALESGARGETESATQQLASALARAVDAPPVKVKVLAARPHARWGELHGLYETSGRRGETPTITLWMRTARQNRLVAFRPFLRTLLHEIAHHHDYTRLQLGDSFHTQGFYQRESHLFHQLVTDGEPRMASLGQQLKRMDSTPDDFAAAIAGMPDHLLSKRPDDANWSATEVMCHIRDIEESFMARMQLIMTMDEPTLLPVEPDRWAAERQYHRNNAAEALQAFRTRREESLKFLRRLRPEQVVRGGLHATRGHMTIADFVSLMVWHDDNHLDQLKRALAGKP